MLARMTKYASGWDVCQPVRFTNSKQAKLTKSNEMINSKYITHFSCLGSLLGPQRRDLLNKASSLLTIN